MYQPNWKTLKINFENLELLYMDCHSIFPHLEKKDMMGDIDVYKSCFDFSKIEENHELFSNVNKTFLEQSNWKFQGVFKLINYLY